MAGVRFLTRRDSSCSPGRWRREGRSFVPPTRREWRDSAIVGALLIGGGMGMVAFGEQTVPSGITALLVAMMPVWVAVFGRIFFGERLPRLAVVGIVVGFVGVAILVGPSAFGGQGALEPIGLAAILISPIAWASGSLFASHRAELPRRPLVATGVQMVVGGALLLVAGVATGEIGQLHLETDLAEFGPGAALPDGRRQPGRLHDLRLDAPRRAAAVRLDLRLRQPGRRGHPRLRHRRRGDRATDDRRGRR